MDKKVDWSKYRRGPVAGLFTYDYLAAMVGMNKGHLRNLCFEFARSEGVLQKNLSPVQIMNFLSELRLQKQLKELSDLEKGVFL